MDSGAKELKIRVYGGPGTRTFAAAFRDIRDGISQHQYWHTLALNDVRARYRRTTIGEFWISLNLLVFVLSIGVFYGVLLGLSTSTYLPYLLVGYTFWSFLSNVIVDGCQTFIVHSTVLQQARTPLTALVLRMVDRAFIGLAHNLLLVVVTLGVFGIFPSLQWLWLGAALALWWLNAMWIGLALGIVCARFRDVLAAVVSLIQLLFLISPVLWRVEDVPHPLQQVSTWNPVYYYLSIVRDPMLGTGAPTVAWLVVVVLTAAGWTLAIALLRSYRSRVVYWV